MWVLSVLLEVVLRLTSIPLLAVVIVMPNNLVTRLINTRVTSWVKIFASPVPESSVPPAYQEEYTDGIAAALDLLRGRLELRAMFHSLPSEDLRRDLRQLVMIQRAIVHVLGLVERTALDVMRIFVDREAEWEQRQEDLERDEVVDASHGVDDGEDFDYDGNLAT